MITQHCLAQLLGIQHISIDLSRMAASFFSITTWRGSNNDLERYSLTERHSRPTRCLTQQMFQQGITSSSNKEKYLSKMCPPPFPGQPAYTPDDSFHHFSFEQQQKYKSSLDQFPPYASLRNGFMLPLTLTQR